MKKLLYTLAAISLSHLVMGQTDTKNYVKTTTYQAKTQNGTTNAATGQALTDDDKIENITYFDGLGRPQQSIAKQAGGNKQHIVTPVVYDAFGRQAKDYLPYTYSSSNSTALNYMSPLDVLEDLESYYVSKYPEDQIASSAINAYSEKVFEASPLGRVLEQGAPGNDWLADPLSDTDHTIKFGYQINSEDEVRSFKVSHPNSDTEQTALEYEGFYTANELYKTVTKDENWQPDPNPLIVNKDHTTEEFKDKQGRVILKRTYNNTVAHDTYYVYDDYGNLTYVLSPEGSDAILDGSNNVLQPVLDKLCYQYHYDYRNRLIEKKIPQKGWEYIVYNKLDQPILTQDANLEESNLWLFTKYDAYGRVAYTGTMSSGDSRATLQSSVNGLVHKNETRITSPSTIEGTDLYYDNQAYPTVNIQQLLTINYYDDYKWDTGSSFEASYLMTLSGLAKTGNQIKKKLLSNNWNAGFKSETTITGDGYIQWAITQSDKRVTVGLSRTDSSPDHNYSTIDYAIYTGDTTTPNRVYIYEEGVSQSIPATYCAAGDVFKVERVGDQILYKKNGMVFYSSSTPSTGALLGDSSFYNIGTIIEDVFIGYSVMGQAFSGNAKSLATGSKVRVLGTNDWITSVNYYDAKGRPIHSTSTNAYLVTKDATSSLLDFTGKVLKTHSTLFYFGGKKGNPIVTVDKFIYDHSGRLLRQVQSINGGTEQLIAKNNYDGLGQLVQKQVGGTLPQWSAYANYEPNVSTAHNVITKTGGTNVWTDAGVSTQTSIQGDGYLSFKVTQVWNSFMAGLSYTDVNVNYNSIKYAIYIISGGKVNVYESGVNKGEKTSYVPGDVFSVERRGTSIYYLKNGEPFYASLVPTTTASMVGDVSILHTGTVIKDLVLVNLENTLQDVDYAYNIRGWLKTINNPSSLGSDLFGFQIGYNNPTVSGATSLYNGNISEALWKTDNIDNSLKSYRYTYDALNRITKGIDNLDRYSLGSTSPVSYDKNGNITGLYRKGHTNMAATTFGVMDNLAYLYDGNQLLRVTDNGNTTFGFKDGNTSGNDYVYDVNGNMTVDRNKNIAGIEYNHLNLPTLISFYFPEGLNNDGITTSGAIEYVYDALGTKQSKTVSSSGPTVHPVPTTTYYAGNYIYEKSLYEPSLKFFNHPEGYVEPAGLGNFDYVYQYKDIWGNVRVTYSDDNNDGSVNSSEIRREQNYYPYGLEHRGYNGVIQGVKNNLKQYQGQEFTEDLGLNTHEWKYRVSDPAIGRFWQIDPLAEDYTYNSTYAFQENKMGMGVELEGLEMAEFYPKGPSDPNFSADGVGAYVALALAVDAVLTKGKITEHLLKQTTIQTSFNLADQAISGESINVDGAINDAVNNADLFDAGFDVMTSKLPGGAILNEAMSHLAPSMVDVTLDGGVQIGGVNKEMSDVAVDFTFAVGTDKVKGTEIPNMKFSGNTMVKKIKDGVIDFVSNEAQNSSSSSSTTRRSSSSSERESNIRVQDNTRIKVNAPKFN